MKPLIFILFLLQTQFLLAPPSIAAHPADEGRAQTCQGLKDLTESKKDDERSYFLDSILASLKHKPKFTFRFDNRNSFISNKNAVINGFKVGIEFAHTLRLGTGYHSLISEFYKPQIIKSNSSVIDTVESLLKLNYISNYVEYVFDVPGEYFIRNSGVTQNSNGCGDPAQQCDGVFSVEWEDAIFGAVGNPCVDCLGPL